jgi:hypothetical protein
MSHRLLPAIAIGCFLYALAQVRMFFVYTGRVRSSTVVPVEGAALAATAAKRALAFSAYGIILLFVAWPKLLTYVSTVWIVEGSVGSVIARVRAVGVSVSTEAGRRRYFLRMLFSLGLRGLAFLAAVYWLGF